MKVSIVTLGCKLNQFESQALSEVFKKEGFHIVPEMDDADTVIVNTCTVTDKADSKCRKTMKQAKQRGKTVIATGCYATTDFDSIQELEYVDSVVNNDNKFSIPGYLKSGLIVPNNTHFPSVQFFEKTRAFIKIQDGCNKFCNYCKIPFARGRSVSLNPQSIKAQMELLIRNGYKEIVLTGVNISDYRYENTTLATLVDMLVQISGDYRLRLSSLQPDEFEDKLIEYLTHPHFANHLHISLQSGSDAVLTRMNRKYTGKYFLDLVRKIRAYSENCGITTDVIVGFGGETEAEFGETLDLAREAEFTRAHIFPYSMRKGTKAEGMGDLPIEVKQEREERLRLEVYRTGKNFIEQKILGRPHRMLVETVENGKATGYTSGYFKTEIDAGRRKANEFSFVTPESIGDDSEAYFVLK